MTYIATVGGSLMDQYLRLKDGQKRAIIAGVLQTRDNLATTELRLRQWGFACSDRVDPLGLPTVSGIARMIDHVRVEDRVQKRIRKHALQKARKAWKAGDQAVDAKVVAEQLGFADPQPTAKGKQTASFLRPQVQFDDDVAELDKVVASLPGWARKIIELRYRYGQPDRIAAKQLRMPLGEYVQRMRAAIARVDAQLSV